MFSVIPKKEYSFSLVNNFIKLKMRIKTMGLVGFIEDGMDVHRFPSVLLRYFFKTVFGIMRGYYSLFIYNKV